MAPNKTNQLYYENEDVERLPAFEKKGKNKGNTGAFSMHSREIVFSLKLPLHLFSGMLMFL